MAINIGTNTDGDVTYQNPPVNRTLFPNIKYGATPEEIQEAVDAWLDDHPEATTTVEDGSILPVKLDSTNSASDGYVLSYNATAEKFEWYDIGGELDEINSDITDLKQDYNQLSEGVLYDYILDEVALKSNGYPVSWATSVSYSAQTQSEPTMPFYKERPIYDQWYPTTDLTGTYRFMTMTPPASVAGKKFSVGFWLYGDLSGTKAFKFGILPDANSFTSLDDGNLAVGYTQTVGRVVLTVDAKVNNWYHFTVIVDDSNVASNTTNILLGSARCKTTDRIKWSPPVVVLGDRLDWFINYKNASYNPDNPIDDTTVSSTKTWSSSQISSAINHTSVLSGKKVNWIGDSLFRGGGSEGNNGWIGRIADDYGCTFESLAVNGAMIIDPQQSGYVSIATRCTDFTETAPDYVIFDGGTNDNFNKTLSPLGTYDADRYDTPNDKTTSFSSAFEYTIVKIITAYPNAKIGYIVPYKLISYNQNIDAYDISGKSYFDRAVEICKKWGVPYLDLREHTPLNYQIEALQDNFTDFVHINSDGYDLTYNIVAKWLETI